MEMFFSSLKPLQSKHPGGNRTGVRRNDSCEIASSEGAEKRRQPTMGWAKGGKEDVGVGVGGWGVMEAQLPPYSHTTDTRVSGISSVDVAPTHNTHAIARGARQKHTLVQTH